MDETIEQDIAKASQPKGEPKYILYPVGHKFSEDNRETKEKRQQGLIDDALKTGKSKIYEGTNGFRTTGEEEAPLNDNIDRFERHMDTATAFAFKDMGERGSVADKGVREIVVVAPLETDVIEERPVRVPHKGFFRTTYTDSKEAVVIAKKPRLMSEITGGDDIPAAAIYYDASGGSSWKGSVLTNEYVDSVGRPGNTLEAKIVVDLNLARQIAEEIKQDPRFIRRLVDGFVSRKYSADFNKKWSYARPPYDRWDQNPNEATYVADLIDDPRSKNLPATQIVEKAIPLNK